MTKLFIFGLAILISSLSFSQLKIKSDDVVVRFHVYSDDVAGKIGNFRASIKFNVDELAESDFNGTVDVSTINTKDKTRDKHLLSSDYFDEAKYPKITFQSTSILKAEDKYKLIGNLKIRDIEKEIEITFSYAEKVFTAKSYIYGKDFNIDHGWKSRKDSKIKVYWKVPVE